jgi:hypothetical protein
MQLLRFSVATIVYHGAYMSLTSTAQESPRSRSLAEYERSGALQLRV